jgi:hypothetical protein
MASGVGAGAGDGKSGVMAEDGAGDKTGVSLPGPVTGDFSFWLQAARSENEIRKVNKVNKAFFKYCQSFPIKLPALQKF